MEKIIVTTQRNIHIMPLLALGLLALGTAVDLIISTVATMVLSSILHDMWWNAVPALGFSEALLVGILLVLFSMVMEMSGPNMELSDGVFHCIFALIIVPLVLPWVIGALNNDIVPAFPDISYGVAFLFTLVGLAFASARAAVTLFLTRKTDDVISYS
jgi:hypothetical protein